MAFSFSIKTLGNNKILASIDSTENGISADELNRYFLSAFEKLNQDHPEVIMSLTLCALQTVFGSHEKLLINFLKDLDKEKKEKI